MWKTSQNWWVRNCALGKWQKHYEHKCSHVRSLMYPYSLWHLLLTAVIFSLVRRDAITFLTCFTKSIFKNLYNFQNPELSLPWSQLKSMKLWNHHLVSLMREQLNGIQSQPGVWIWKRQEGNRNWENNLSYQIKNKQTKRKILTACPVSWYLISCKKQELKFTEIKITEKWGYNLIKE